MSTMINYENFDFSTLNYSDPKQNNIGNQTVFINDLERNKIRLCTPKCYLPFGLSNFNDRYSIQFSLNKDVNRNISLFIAFLEKFDQQNIDKAVSNSKSWFKKSLNKETINELYTKTLKQSNKKYPPLFSARVPFKDGKCDIEIYDTNKNLISIDEIKPGCHVEAIVELTGVYFVSKGFGLSWKIVQLKVHPSNRISGYSFEDDSDDDSDAEPSI